MKKTLIVTPTYNEADNLNRFVEGVRAAAPKADLMIVDDASPDGTGDIADDIARRDPHVHVIHRAGKLGLGTAYVEAFQWGLPRGYDWFFEMDADFSHDVRFLPEFFEALERGADVVIGSRNISGGGVEGWGLGRHVISKGGSFYSRTILGLPRAGSHERLQGILAPRARDDRSRVVFGRTATRSRSRRPTART